MSSSFSFQNQVLLSRLCCIPTLEWSFLPLKINSDFRWSKIKNKDKSFSPSFKYTLIPHHPPSPLFFLFINYCCCCYYSFTMTTSAFFFYIIVVVILVIFIIITIVIIISISHSLFFPPPHFIQRTHGMTHFTVTSENRHHRGQRMTKMDLSEKPGESATCVGGWLFSLAAHLCFHRGCRQRHNNDCLGWNSSLG